MPPFARRLRVVHRHPGIGYDQIGAYHRFVRVAFGGIKTGKGGFGIERRRAGEHQIEIKGFSGMGEAGEYVVAVA